MTESATRSITVCTVTPVYSGDEYLRALVDELEQLRNDWARRGAPMKLVESIFVDDGSIDGSAEILSKLADQFPWVTIVTLSRNFGQHAATVAGICHSSSHWVVTLDEDLQHKPALFDELFLTQASNSADVVYANPKLSAHGNSWRDKTSRSVKRILAKLT